MDRRTVWAILLMMAIAITPAIFLKRPARPNPAVPTTADTAVRGPAAALRIESSLRRSNRVSLVSKA